MKVIECQFLRCLTLIILHTPHFNIIFNIIPLQENKKKPHKNAACFEQILPPKKLAIMAHFKISGRELSTLTSTHRAKNSRN